MGKSKFLDSGITIEDVVSKLVELGYICLCEADFNRLEDSSRRMEMYPVKCLYSHKKRCYDCDLYCVDAWNPERKEFLEMEFLFSGEILLEKTKMTIGKNSYIGEKAVQLARRLTFEE